MEAEAPVTRFEESGRRESLPAEEALRKAVRARVFPGAAACAGSSAGVLFSLGVGRHDHAGGPPATPRSLYDLASLTKVVATTAVVMRLWEEGKVSLEARARDFLPRFEGGGREAVTLEHLLTHSSGLPAWRPLFREARTREEALDLVLATPLESPPGSAERYSDLGAIVLGECAARAAGVPLAALTWKLVLEPLAMRDTCFLPPLVERRRIPPTEEDREVRGRLIHGEVHDENAWVLGGVSGHAGLFSTAEDLGRFAVEVLRSLKGLPGPRLFKPDTVRRFTTRRELVPGSSRALGWDTRSDEEDGTGPRGSRSSSGRRFGRGSFGHTGFTGTSLWFDPARDLFAVLLSNRVHPTRAGAGILEARREFHDAVVLGLEPLEERVRAAAARLGDSWFLVEREGKPLGYHRSVVELRGAEVVVSDEMALLPLTGRLAFRSEVTSSLDLFSPSKARCETRLGPGEGSPALQGTLEFEGDRVKLWARVLVNEAEGILEKPRVHEGAEKRPGRRILFQSLVPLLLASLPEGEDGSGLGEVVLAALPADVDRLVGFKPGRRIAVHRVEGGRKAVLSSPEGEPSEVLITFGPAGEVTRVELEGYVERRSSREEVRRAVPGAFGGR